MSLNFVSTTVLSSTDGVSHDKETHLDNSETAAVARAQNYKPLYEQLRTNAQEDQEKYDEVTKAMRGTRALDDEDVAHLQGIEDQRSTRLRVRMTQEQDELEKFRLAKLDYQEANRIKELDTNDASNDDNEDYNVNQQQLDRKDHHAENDKSEGWNIKGIKNDDSGNICTKKSSFMQLQSKIKVTKKRKRINKNNLPNATNFLNGSNNRHVAKKTSSESSSLTTKNDDENPDNKNTNNDSEENKNNSAGALSGLLEGYGSDSDSD
mmetsp:Transcript_16535/g.19157  ORF Transcript_16535/g.19157 Transcript_16535/m.19157 type:complete len:265 (+) Transcript_16535:95-889(+)